MIDRYLSLDGALGAELQQSLSPADAVALLKDGVRRSTSGEASARNREALLEGAAAGQYPYAAVLSCIDSRAPVEQIFDAASGDLFVARVAGNVASPISSPASSTPPSTLAARPSSSSVTPSAVP